MLRVPLEQLDAELPMPRYARDGDAGADLVARADVVLPCRGGRAVVQTGVAIAIPKGREPAMEYLRRFVEQVQTGGLLAQAVARAGLRGVVPAQ